MYRYVANCQGDEGLAALNALLASDWEPVAEWLLPVTVSDGRQSTSFYNLVVKLRRRRLSVLGWLWWAD